MDVTPEITFLRTMNHAHTLSAVIQLDGRNYRVTCKNVLFQRRCLNCSLSHKSHRFCYALDATFAQRPYAKAHGYPCVNEAFNGVTLNSFMRVNMFQDLCCTPIIVQLDSFTWTEDDDTFSQRVATFNSLSDDWNEAKGELFQIIAEVQSSWFSSRHDSTCDDDECGTCKLLRKKLKNQFRTLVQKGYEDRVYQSFMSGVVIDTTGYEDDRVSISVLN